MAPEKEPAHKKGVQRAIDIFGTQQALADAISESFNENIKQAHIHKWLHLVKKLPLERAVQIQTVTNGKVTAKELRPDINIFD